MSYAILSVFCGVIFCWEKQNGVQSGNPETSPLFAYSTMTKPRPRRTSRGKELRSAAAYLENRRPGGRAYVLVSGMVRVTTIDEDHQEVVIDQPAQENSLASIHARETPHQTNAIALDETICIEVDRHDIAVLLERKPHAGMDMLTVLGRQFHASQQLVRVRAARNPNEVIEEEETFGERIADRVAALAARDLHHSFGSS